MARADPISSMAKSHNLTIFLKIKKQNRTPTPTSTPTRSYSIKKHHKKKKKLEPIWQLFINHTTKLWHKKVTHCLKKKKKIIIAYTKNPPKPDQSASKGWKKKGVNQEISLLGDKIQLHSLEKLDMEDIKDNTSGTDRLGDPRGFGHPTKGLRDLIT